MALQRLGGPEPEPGTAADEVAATVRTSIPRPRVARHVPTAASCEYVVLARSGRLRAVVIVSGCPFCGGTHLHQARTVLVRALRHAPCTGRLYALGGTR